MKLFYILLLILTFLKVHSQEKFRVEENHPLMSVPLSYQVSYSEKGPAIDGILDDDIWTQAEWTAHFIDIEGPQKPVPAFKTRVKMLWNDTALFIAAELEEPHVWATIKTHDDIIFHDNDFEVFIDPDNNTLEYFEVEVNAFNTIFDLFLPRPYRNGTGALIAYDVKGLQSAVHIDGTINDPADKDRGWSVEMAIPFRSLYMGNHWRAPRDKDLWRINFSRVQWDTDTLKGMYNRKKDARGKLLPEKNWVWSPQGIINMHYPERWGYLQFVKGSNREKFNLPYDEKRKSLLWLIYYRQGEYHSRHGKYAHQLDQLGIESASTIDGKRNILKLETGHGYFMAYIADKENTLRLSQDGKILKIKSLQ